MFPKFPTSIIGYGDTIEIPKIAQDDQADYEGELVILIGKDAKNVSEADAWDYIVGYAVGNDVSARYLATPHTRWPAVDVRHRKWQMDPELVGTHPPPQMSFSKAFDTFCPIGPCIVAAHVSRFLPLFRSGLFKS
jgi:2-keto-4-pentenoate hydratase/2-oxohepta-3-ene-1,7-dioic acid hydratase in catechol pathway